MKTHYRVTPLDPLIARDARPFGAGGRVRSLDWPLQSTVAGAIRTALWKKNNDLTPEILKTVSVCGAFPVLDGEGREQLCFPRPLDILAHKKDGKLEIHQILPSTLDRDEHVDMPGGVGEALRLAAPDTDEDFKPEKLRAFWPLELMLQWLKSGKEGFVFDDRKDALAAPARDERTHVRLDPNTGTARDGLLFSTTGLDFTRKTFANPEKKEGLQLSEGQMAIGVDFGKLSAQEDCLSAHFLAPLGGERRLAEFREDGDGKNLWSAPDLSLGKDLRMVLATPAVFKNGWLPGWVDKQSLEGLIPGTSCKLKLVSAVTGRWQPLSGWSYEGKGGPKPLRRAVPAGSVYFFEVLDGKPDLKEVWLRSVCDDEQDRRDGFGLTLWGNWQS